MEIFWSQRLRMYISKEEKDKEIKELEKLMKDKEKEKDNATELPDV